MRVTIRWKGLLAATTVAMTVVACGSGGGSNSDGTESASAAPSIDQTAGLPADLIEAATKEGQLVMATTLNNSAHQAAIYDQFSKAFGIKVVQTSGDTADLTSRVLAERSQGVHSVDVGVLAGEATGAFLDADALQDVNQMLVVDGVRDPADWLTPSTPWWFDEDVEKKHAFDYLVRQDPNITRMYYNSSNVTEDDLGKLTSMQDFITDPRWKGKIVIPGIQAEAADGAQTGLDTTWLVLGKPWFEELFSKNPPTVVGPGLMRDIIDGLGRGTWDICLFCEGMSAEADKAEKDGLPISQLTKTLKEGPSTNTTAHTMVFDGAPHPNAAKLFVNWILSKQGQATINEYIDPAVASGAAAMRKSAPQGKQPDELWARLHSDPLKFYDAAQVAQAEAEVSAAIPELFAKYGIKAKS